MPADALPIESLASPLDDAAPAGPDLGYAPAFQAMELAGSGRPERQYGDKVFAAEPPDWPAVREHALALAARTRDLRVTSWLLRSATQLQGLAGAAAGLELQRRQVESLWQCVHPSLDPADGLDPTARLSALAPMFAAEALIADLRQARVAPERGSLTLRDIELGLGAAAPFGDEVQPTRDGVLTALGALLAVHPEIADQVETARAAAAAIARALEQHVGTDRAPDARPLLALLQVAADAVAACRGAPAAHAITAGSMSAAPALGTARTAADGSIGSRADAVRELDRVCAWIEQHEPSNPAPLLIRRAQRLMNKSFIDIVRDLAPEGLEQVARLAGTEAEH